MNERIDRMITWALVTALCAPATLPASQLDRLTCAPLEISLSGVLWQYVREVPPSIVLGEIWPVTARCSEKGAVWDGELLSFNSPYDAEQALPIECKGAVP